MLGSSVGVVQCGNGLLRLPGDRGRTERKRETNTDGQEPTGPPETADTDQNEGERSPRQEVAGKVVIISYFS